MKSHRLATVTLASLASALCLGAVGCGGDEGASEPSQQASEVQQQEEKDGSGGGDSVARGGDGGDGKNGQDGEDGESVTSEGGTSSSSQSSSITQSGDGDEQVAQVTQDGGGEARSSISGGPGGASRITGNGDSSVSFDVDKPSRFVWISDAGRTFSVRGGGVSIDSRAGRGETSIGPGDKDLDVRGSNWTIVIQPRR